MNDREYYNLWLSSVTFLRYNPLLLNRLLKYFKDARGIYNANDSNLMNIRGMNQGILSNMREMKTDKSIISIWKHAESTGMKVTFKGDSDYPELLADLEDAPFALYYYGDLPSCDKACVGIVGSRNNSYYGNDITIKISRELASENVAVISGMALGIDRCAHVGALQAKGYTCAVLGSGSDVCYPHSNADIYEKIKKDGCVLSEHPPRTKSLSHHFPLRNRIISGISDALIVVEAGKRSGSLITARLALEQNRDVFAIPGRIGDVQSEGTNELIKRFGAQLITSAEDVLEAIRAKGKLPREIKANSNEYKEKELTLFVSDELMDKVYNCFESKPLSVIDICKTAEEDEGAVTSALMNLKLKGLIRECYKNKYTKVKDK